MTPSSSPGLMQSLIGGVSASSGSAPSSSSSGSPIPGIIAPDPTPGSQSPSIPIFGVANQRKRQSSSIPTFLSAAATPTVGQRGQNTLIGQP